ncbi:MAG TPA: hypothetical protein VII81_03050 [Terriglobales bacterium]
MGVLYAALETGIELMAETLQCDVEHRTPDVVYVRPQQAKFLHSGPAKIVRTALIEIDAIVAQLAQCATRVEFVALREKLHNDYVNLSYIIANSFSMSGDHSVRQQAVNQAIKNVEQFIQAEGVTAFGAEPVREALFCFDTLRRAYRLVYVIHGKVAAPASAKDKDRALAASFNSTALWSQLHLDCMRVVVARKVGVSQDVLDEILAGSRLAVMAYSYVRQGIALRTEREWLPTNEALDDEDRKLLAESFSDYVESESAADAES